MGDKLHGDVTKPHLRKFFKIVPMKDEAGNPIQNNPPLNKAGFWGKPSQGIKIDGEKKGGK